MKKIRFILEYLILQCVNIISNILPLGIALLFGRILGGTLWFIDKKHRKIAEANFKIAFPEKPDVEVEAAIKKTYKNLGMIVVELCRQHRLNRDNISKIIPRDGLEKVEELLKRDKGVIIIGGHIGSWEMSGFGISAHGLPMNAIGRPLDNPYLDKFLVSRRESSGQKIISKFGGMRDVLRVLKKKECIGLLVDQNAGREGIFVEFFNKIASTWHTTAMLAMKTGAPVIAVSSYREDNYIRHRFIVSDEIEVIKTGNDDEDMITNTRNFNKVLEDIIRQHPEQWLWLHRRWKTRPLDEIKNKGNENETES